MASITAQHGTSPRTYSNRERLVHRRHQYAALRAVIQRRDRQDARWGGPLHDDTHSPEHWVDLVRTSLGQADRSQDDPLRFEDKMLDIAALALAAVESGHRRARGDAAGGNA